MKRQALSIGVWVLCVGAVGGARWATAGQGTPSQIATPPEITVQDTPVGPMLADVKGFSLYVTDRDKEPGTSSCYGPCAEQWVPVRAQADAKPFGEWSIVSRSDGQPQWAFKGRPLYRYRWEGKARWAEAQNEYWRYASLASWPVAGAGRRGFAAAAVAAKIVLPPSPGGVTGQVARLGNVFADAKGMTLYSRAGVCAGACLDTWVPLRAPQTAAPVGDWTIVTGNDGTPQWAYKGHPVYRSVKDGKPSDTNGVQDQGQPIFLPSTAASSTASSAPAAAGRMAPSQPSRGSTAAATSKPKPDDR